MKHHVHCTKQPLGCKTQWNYNTVELRRSCFILLTAATSLPMRRAIIHVGVQTALRFSAAHPVCCQRSPHFAVASSSSHKLEQSSFMFCQVQNFPYLPIISNTNYEDTKTLSSALPSQSLKLSEHHPACTEWLPFLQQAAFLSNWFIPTTDHTTNFATKNRLLFMSHINLCKVAAGSTSHITWPLQLAIDHPETPLQLPDKQKKPTRSHTALETRHLPDGCTATPHIEASCATKPCKETHRIT